MDYNIFNLFWVFVGFHFDCLDQGMGLVPGSCAFGLGGLFGSRDG